MNRKILIYLIIAGTIAVLIMILTNKNEKEENMNNILENNTNSIKIIVNDEVLNVELENNKASIALVNRLKKGDIIIEASDYNNFEKVGDLGFNLPTDDQKITTRPGDLILYQGNKLCLYYGVNTWNFTKLGRINNKSSNELIEILGKGNINLILTLN